MDLDINLLPEEYKSKPPLDARTFLMIIVILALIGAAFFLFQTKGGIDSEIEELNDSIAKLDNAINLAIENPEEEQLKSQISKLEKEKSYYETFVDSRILWGDNIETIYYAAPKEVTISSMRQNKKELTITGKTESYTDISGYAKTLSDMERYALVKMPTYSSGGSYTLIIEIEGGPSGD